MVQFNAIRKAQILLASCMFSGIAFGAAIANSSTGITLNVQRNGYHKITVHHLAWEFTGNIGRSLTNITILDGEDNIGCYREISFKYLASVPRQGAVRVYCDKPVLLFIATYLGDGPNADPFPVLTSYPQGLHTLTYEGVWAQYRFNVPAVDVESDGPWIFFNDQSDTFVLSPASHFLSASTRRISDGSLVAGISSGITRLKNGFTHQTILVIGKGINHTFGMWGQRMTDLSKKTRRTSDSEVALSKIIYMTSASSAYYYSPIEAFGFEGTLKLIQQYYVRNGIPLGSMELDSWWYPKGSPSTWTAEEPAWKQRESGMYELKAAIELFPNGLGNFQKELALPLIAHARWVSNGSIYRQRIPNPVSGNVITDIGLWNEIAQYLRENGVIVFEQDWLSGPAVAENNLEAPHAFLSHMAKAFRAAGMSIQYSMPLPSHFLKSTEQDNVTMIRVSFDGFGTDKRDVLLYGSHLASSLGIWPWVDVVSSNETKNLLLVTLSAGPVGIGDALGSENLGNLRRVVRRDGVIVKPDAPLAPVDGVYVDEAAAGEGQAVLPAMVAASSTDHGTMKTLYAFAYRRGVESTITILPASLDLLGVAYVYDYFKNTGRLVDSNAVIAPSAFSDTVDSDGSYYIIVPVGPSKIGFLGDKDKFVSLGRQRVNQLQDDGVLSATITFAEGETTVTLFGYSENAPVAGAVEGTIGKVYHNSVDHLFRVDVSPNRSGYAVIKMQQASK